MPVPENPDADLARCWRSRTRRRPWPRQSVHACRFVRVGGTFHRLFAHYVVSERPVARNPRLTDGLRCSAATIYCGKVPVPCLGQHVVGNGSTLTRSRIAISRLRQARRDTNATIAHHQPRNAVPERCRSAVPADLCVVVRAGRQTPVRQHNRLRQWSACRAFHLPVPPLCRLAARRRHGRAGAVHNKAVFDQDAHEDISACLAMGAVRSCGTYSLPESNLQRRQRSRNRW